MWFLLACAAGGDDAVIATDSRLVTVGGGGGEAAGLGVWLWYLSGVGYSSHSDLARDLAELGVRRIYIKVADGSVSCSAWPEVAGPFRRAGACAESAGATVLMRVRPAAGLRVNCCLSAACLMMHHISNFSCSTNVLNAAFHPSAYWMRCSMPLPRTSHLG